MTQHDLHEKRLFGTATVGTKGQVVIPAEAREALGIETGDKLYVVGVNGKKLIAFLPEDELRAMLNKMMAHVADYKDILEK